jgi:hydroxymethylglutaryl-CoA reductase (NADPH)
LSGLTDEEVLKMMHEKKVRLHELERVLKSLDRAVKVRREFVKQYMQLVDEDKAKPKQFDNLPYQHFDYTEVYGSNCENVVGYVPVPVGIAGPILVDGKEYPLPMATTEGALVASTHRGARALSESGGVRTAVLEDGMTRGPVVSMPTLAETFAMKRWCDGEGQKELDAAFRETSRFARLRNLKVTVVGRVAYMRFMCFTGDAMGMNMASKATAKALDRIKQQFPALHITSLSGNYCSDKKSSAINWVEGRGKSVTVEATLTKKMLQEKLKCDAPTLAKLNERKNLVGSALAGSIGGFNAHAANVVAAMFIATGQDPAQVIASSQCITLFEALENGDLYCSLLMPSIEVGTVGGGTQLSAQKAMLQIMGVDGPNYETPGDNAKALARVIASGVMAAELSLMASLAEGTLMRAHMDLNRK